MRKSVAVRGAGLVAICFLLLAASTRVRPDAVVPVPSAAPMIGIATVETMIPGGNAARDVALAKQVGAKAVKIPVGWNLIEPWAKSHLDWSVTDSAVEAAHASGLEILLMITGPAPTWALRPQADPYASGNGPADPRDFGDFVRQAALRYGTDISAFQIWNEPNISRFLIPPTPAAYLPLLKAAYTAIRSIGSKAPIITAGTSSAREETRDIAFIIGLYDLGGSQYFDGIGLHPYTLPYPLASDPRFGDGGGAAVLTLARTVMVSRGDAAKKIWITEYGQPTGDTTVSVSESKQAAILVDAIILASRENWIAAFFIFNTRDLAAGSASPDENFGLFRFDYSPKEAAFAVWSVLRNGG